MDIVSIIFVAGMVISILAICVTFLLLKVIDKRCTHTWETTKIIDVYDTYDEQHTSKKPIYHKAFLRCSKCGDVKCNILR